MIIKQIKILFKSPKIHYFFNLRNSQSRVSWILNEVDIILLVETWEHEESKVPNIDGFVLWSIWNKQSYRTGIGGIACYIRKNISPHASLYKKTLTTNIFG